MFAPGDGVPEDPATGSAAGPLALHLARHGRIAFGDEIEISQGAEIGRPSTLYARVDGSADARRGDRGRRQRRRRRARRVPAALERPERDGFDLREVEHERLPEAAAVVECQTRCFAAKRIESGSSSSIAIARPGGRPPPASCQVRPASCETTSGGRRSTRATRVEPEPTQARTAGSETWTCGGGSRRAPASISTTPSSASIVRTASAVCTSTRFTAPARRASVPTSEVARRAAATGASPAEREAR